MESEILLVGRGNYGQFLQAALSGLSLKLTAARAEEINLASRPQRRVIIALPPARQAGLVAQALAAGKDVLGEKPLALTNQAVRELYDLAAKHQRYLGVGFVLSNHPFYQALKALQASLGPLKEMRVVNWATEHFLRSAWYWDKKQSGGWFTLSEVHWYHLFAFLTEAETLTVAKAEEEIKDGRTQATHSQLITPHGATLTVDHRLDSSYDAASCLVTLVFEQGRAVIDGWIPRLLALPPRVSLPWPWPEEFVSLGQAVFDSRPRETIYYELIRTNVAHLLEGAAFDEEAVTLAHRAAFAAQGLSDHRQPSSLRWPQTIQA